MACLDTRDKVYSSEDFGCHRYILSFETLRLIWSHQQLEPILTANCWEPVSVCKFKGWREYHYYKPKMSSSEESVILRKRPEDCAPPQARNYSSQEDEEQTKTWQWQEYDPQQL
ncbi:hypothetical protein AXG93_2964s1090 [Marchantia polymorpha subsp. ruderalis]|uniref:Uncharacterized protein n=1 Tax=Marchantia polymorpha subsp. ruderalis TaxID=1480154 RepID=A0A176VKG6_MARPO|nr:hypothetical protein AXG93_2964s1090 [Marchantia polymorpha subsp. ruderalis]